MLRALGEFDIEGIPTTIPAHRLLLDLPEFLDGSYTTKSVEGGALDALTPATVPPATDTPVSVAQAALIVDGRPVRLWNPAMAASAAGATRGGGDAAARGGVVAPMHGTILKVLVAEGDAIEAGDPVAVLEAMKMETHLAAPSSGVIKTVAVEPGDVVEAGQVIVVMGRRP